MSQQRYLTYSGRTDAGKPAGRNVFASPPRTATPALATHPPALTAAFEANGRDGARQERGVEVVREGRSGWFAKFVLHVWAAGYPAGDGASTLTQQKWGDISYCVSGIWRSI